VTEINFTLLGELATKPHPLLNLIEGGEYLLRIDDVLDRCNGGVGEVMYQARTAHHLLDVAGIPQGQGYSSDLDARTWQLVVKMQGVEEALSRIAAWHSQEQGSSGTVGSFCNECGTLWPCDTRRMAEGTFVDEDSP
jgi:hypothetical protein